MSQVTLNVGGRNYTVSCADGEEAHVGKLGAALDAKIRQLGENVAPQESQNLLFAGVLLADELHELRLKLDDTEKARAKAEEERANVASSLGNAQSEREQFQSRIAELESDLAAAQKTQPQNGSDGMLPPQIATGQDENLAPALEEFADRLEECAAKLEARG